MARPRKNNAEWFSHDNNLRDDLKIKAVRTKFNLNGYAIFLMILEVLTDSDHFQIEDSDFQIEIMSGDFRIETDELKQMLEYFKHIGLLQFEDGKIFSKHLIDRMNPLLSKRENMRQKHQGKGVSEAETPKEKKSKISNNLMTEEDFESFWKAYPIKEEKKKAKEKFMKLNKTLLQKILSSIEENKNKNEKWLNGYIKQPTTWINGECWNDEISTFIPNKLKNESNQKSFVSTRQGHVSTEGHADMEV